MRKPSPALVVAIIALFIALSGAGIAATGNTFILGAFNSTTKASSLSAPVAGGKALQVTNGDKTSAGSTALGLNVAPGHAPLTVNSSAEVKNLNAGFLNGLDSNEIEPDLHVASATGSVQIPQKVWTTILQVSGGRIEPQGLIAIQGQAVVHFTPAGSTPTTPHLLLRLMVNGVQAAPAALNSYTVSSGFDATVPVMGFVRMQDLTGTRATVQLQASTNGGIGTLTAGNRFLIATRTTLVS